MDILKKREARGHQMKKGSRQYDVIGFLLILITLMMAALAANILFINNEAIATAKIQGGVNQDEIGIRDGEENFFIHVINKSMSVLEISYKQNGGKDVAAHIRNLLGKRMDLDYKNPKNLIKAQISMIKDVEKDIDDIDYGVESEDNDTIEIYIAKENYLIGDQPLINSGDSSQPSGSDNPYKGDIQVISLDEPDNTEEGQNNSTNTRNQGMNSEIEIVSTPVPTPKKIVHSMDEPLVFIYHTHGTESYRPETVGNYHSLNRKYTVLRVGEEMTENLENSGFKVIHDDTIHDYPSYEGSYKRSLETLSKNLKENQSLKVVLDIHRDGINNVDELESDEYEAIRKRSYVTIDGEKVSRFAMVLGGGNDNIEELKQFAYYIKAVSDELYPGFARPIILKKFRYNQYKSDHYALLEVGNNTNTIEEAERAAKYLSIVLSAALKKCIVSE